MSLEGDPVFIFGLGLMGGSLALALRGKVASITAFDPDPGVIQQARQQALVDEAVLLTGAGEKIMVPAGSTGRPIVILAAPVRTILTLLEQLPGWIPGPALVMDIGSTKRVIAEAMQRLPERFDPLPAHPMCGKERSGLENAEAGIFADAAFILTPLKRSSAAAVQTGRELAAAIGARPLQITPAEHDRLVAAISHLPYVLANALAAATPAQAAPLIGSGYRSTSRLAVSPPAVMLDILETNREEVIEAIGRLQQSLSNIKMALMLGDQTGLRAALEAGLGRQERILAAAKEASS